MLSVEIATLRLKETFIQENKLLGCNVGGESNPGVPQYLTLIITNALTLLMADSILFEESGDSTLVYPYIPFLKEELHYLVLIDPRVLIYLLEKTSFYSSIYSTWRTIFARDPRQI